MSVMPVIVELNPPAATTTVVGLCSPDWQQAYTRWFTADADASDFGHNTDCNMLQPVNC